MISHINRYGGFMCGIVGAVCKAGSEKVVLDALQKIEYRGYDSAGICLKNGCQCHTYKTKGYIKKLKEIVPFSLAPVSIAHTRWATHGKVCELNAHPISSEDGAWTIVHNGIIENFEELKSMLQTKGVKFFTETDSEVIAALLALETFSNPLKNVSWVAKKLKGSFAFCAIKNDVENVIYSARSGSPLYAAYLVGGSMIASDPICFSKGNYFRLEDGEICKITQKNIEFYDFFCKKLQKNEYFLSNVDLSTDKGEFSHYMIKEIYETPQALFNLAKHFQNINREKIKKLKFDKVKLIGCGTAYHACEMGASFFRSALKVDAQALPASEYRYGNFIIDSKTLCIFVSQSGETADTIAAFQKAEQASKSLIVLTNVPHSTLAGMCEIVLPICAGREIAVASTKAYSNQVAALFVLSQIFGDEERFWRAIKQVVELANVIKFFDNDVEKIAKKIADHDKMFFIGKGEDYITALEAALKLKEISYINCSAFAAGELKHGTLALIEEGTPVVVIATNKRVFKKVMNSALEAKSRGAKLFLISQFEPSDSEIMNFEEVIKLNYGRKMLKNIQAILPLQLLSYDVCLLKNLDPDKPRNLAKSVTVE